MADKSAGGVAGGELPQAESLIPRGGQSVGAVRGDDLRSPARQSRYSFISARVVRVSFPPSLVILSPLVPSILPTSSLPLETPSRQACKKTEGRTGHTQSETMWEWPWSDRLGYPYCDSSRVRFQTISVLSRLADRSMLGLRTEEGKSQHRHRHRHRRGCGEYKMCSEMVDWRLVRTSPWR